MLSLLKIFLPAVIAYLAVLGSFGYFKKSETLPRFGAPVSNVLRNVIPQADLTYDLGTSTPAARWLTIAAQNASTTNLTAFGTLLVGGTATSTIRGDSATSTFSGGLQISGVGNFCLDSGTCLGAGGITSLNGLTGATQTFSANGPLDIVSGGTVHVFNASSSPYFGSVFASSTLTVSGVATFTSGINSGNDIGVWNNSAFSYYSDTGVTSTGQFGVYGSPFIYLFANSLGADGGLDFANMTVDRTFTLPDKNITFAGINNETFTGLTTMAGFISTGSSTVTGEFHAGTLDIDNFASGDLIVQGDIYNYGGDHFLGTGLATTTLKVDTANVLTISGGGLFAQASSTVAGAFNASGAVVFPGGLTLTCASCITDANVINTITLDNLTQITTRAISDTTGTLAIARGGTNATSFTTSGNAVYYDGTSLLTAPLGLAVTTPYASTTAISSSGSAYFATSAGNVGIGTTSPGAPLHIQSASTNRIILDNTGASPTQGLNIQENGVPKTLIQRDGTRLSIYVGDDATRDMVILDDGNIGIGTTSPGYLLSVAGSNTSAALTAFAIENTSTANNTTKGIELQLNGRNTLDQGKRVGAIRVTSAIDGDFNHSIMTLFARGSDADVAAITILGQTGNVGIGTTSPLFKLSVDGNTFLAGSLQVGGTLKYPKDKSIVVASTTLAYIGAYGSTGTTTLRIISHTKAITIYNFHCRADGGTGAWAALGTGTATTTYVNCTGAGNQAFLTTNNTWTIRQNVYLEIGNQTGNPNYYTITANIEE